MAGAFMLSVEARLAIDPILPGSIWALPPRTDGNRRVYAAGDLRRLTFIRHAHEPGFDVDAIRTLLALQEAPNQSCATADAIAGARLAEVEQSIASLTALKTERQRMVAG